MSPEGEKCVARTGRGEGVLSCAWVWGRMEERNQIIIIDHGQH